MTELVRFFLFYVPVTCLRLTSGVRVPQVEYHWYKVSVRTDIRGRVIRLQTG